MRTRMTIARCSAARLLALLAVLAAGFGANAALPESVDPTRLSAGHLGRIVDTPSGRGEGELFTFDVALAPRLLALLQEESLRVDDWPIAPGVRRSVVLSRREIYAPGAKIYRVNGKILTEIPKSSLSFFIGTDTEGAGNRFMVSLDPASGAFRVLVHGPEGVHEISRDTSDAQGRHLLARPQEPPGGGKFECGQEDSVETSFDVGPSSGRAPAERAALVLSSLHSAVVAIDTDNEYMQAFGNDTAAVTNYLAQLLSSINVMYERDLDLRLLQGTTFLRVSTVADPYTPGGTTSPGCTSGSGNADCPRLNEFKSYWQANYAGVPRSLAALISGKQSGSGSASGIAYLAGSVCGSSSDYSFSQLFHPHVLSLDTLILGHEMGHNLGSPHTHCYSNPAPDRCYAGEPCYSGPTSCPTAQTINGVANVTGTLLSYCHLSGIAGCGSSLVFHPLTISRYVGSTLDAGAASGCLAVVGGGTSPPPSVSAATTFNALTPCRVLDTRNATGPLGGPSIGALGQRPFVVTGVICGVPAGAVAVSANVTAVNPAATGDLLVYPNGISSPPTVSTLSFRAGRTRANNTLVYLASDGSVLVKNNAAGTLDLVLDVNGYFK